MGSDGSIAAAVSFGDSVFLGAISGIGRAGMSIRIVGAGATGINVLDEWLLLSDRPEGSLACDGEVSSVEGSLASEKLLLAPELVGGLGCFGSRNLAWRMVGQESRRLDVLLRDCSRLLILTGLAGATGATVAEALSLKAVEREIPTTIFAFSPFPFEDEERREAAEATRDAFPAETSVFLFSPPDLTEGAQPCVAGVRRRLREFHGSVAQWVDVWAGIAHGVVHPSPGKGVEELVPFAVGENVDCRMFSEEGDRLDHSSLSFLEESTFRQAVEKTDRCLAYVEASEVASGWDQELGERLRHSLPGQARISYLRRAEARPRQNRLLLLVARVVSRLPKSDRPESRRRAPAPAEVPVRSRAWAEPEARLVHASAENTPFSKTAATLHKGENLDIPAFRRRSRSRLPGA